MFGDREIRLRGLAEAAAAGAASPPSGIAGRLGLCIRERTVMLRACG
jgi:hypothetical protein